MKYTLVSSGVISLACLPKPTIVSAYVKSLLVRANAKASKIYC